MSTLISDESHIVKPVLRLRMYLWPDQEMASARRLVLTCGDLRSLDTADEPDQVGPAFSPEATALQHVAGQELANLSETNALIEPVTNVSCCATAVPALRRGVGGRPDAAPTARRGAAPR